MSYIDRVSYNSAYHITVMYSSNTQNVVVQQIEWYLSFGTNNSTPGDPNGEGNIISFTLQQFIFMCHIAPALLLAVKDSVVEVMAGVVAYWSQIGIEITNQNPVLHS